MSSDNDVALSRRSAMLSGCGALAALLIGTDETQALLGAGITDAGRVLGAGERARLERQVKDLEAATGLHVRIYTTSVSGLADREALVARGTNDVIIVADTRGGNILYTRVSDDVYTRLPRSFWIELPNRFGTQFYVSDHGIHGALSACIHAISTCASAPTCAAVPGVSDDQLLISTVSAAIAGAIFGAAARTGGKRFNLPFLLLYSPIWSIFLISFGLAPVLARLRGPAHPETAVVTAAFLAVAAAIWYWVPRGIGASGSAKQSGGDFS